VILPIATDVTITWYVRLCVCVCVCYLSLVHPAKAVGWNEMQFGSDIHVIACNIVLDGPQSPLGKRRFGRSEPTVCSCRQITLAVVVADAASKNG